MEVHRGSAAIEAAIAAAAATVRERASSTTPSPTCRLIVMLDPERIPALHRPMDAFRQGHGPAGKALRELLEGGSLVGVHAVLSSASLSQLAVVLDERRELGRFMHRACLQVAEDDSYALFRNRRGSALQDPDDPVSMALYMDMETSTSCRFRPYAQLGLSESTDHSDGGNT
jgi:hypothetical protein